MTSESLGTVLPSVAYPGPGTESHIHQAMPLAVGVRCGIQGLRDPSFTKVQSQLNLVGRIWNK